MLGCSNTNGISLEIMSKESSTNDSWSVEYKKLNGLKSKTINLDKGQIVKFDIVSEDGDLGLTIEDENGDSCFNKEVIDTSNFEFTPESNGKYKMLFNAKNHKGGFNVSWSKKDSK